MKPFFSLEVKGLENVPKDARGAVIVCNHQSTLDMLIGSWLGMINFKVTFKRELLFMPGA
jgi:1-acyl-sn-glycerol-3-phosphate acyltransferase